ncbi:MAG: UDP-N-acetylmuramoyl-tripeptide--D-alanyl-D-alanine ligase [Spirochaetales bacterium]|nr:UDP-N-acetylmuramoyl-tripeptide--D-alanyl-D-alanine ligase [Spirochaetales bacterium]
MKRELFTIDELIKAVKGECVYTTGHLYPVHSVVIDSRSAETLSLFIPLKGEHSDGHEFLRNAVENGARTLFVSTAYWQEHKAKVLHDLEDRQVSIVAVADPLGALQECAKTYLEQFPSLYRIGITGSNGKTTTKEILGSLLARGGETIINKGNFNSEIGLPLSVLRVLPMHRFGVFEMGMNHRGEMEVLSNIVQPDAALITTIGSAHIGILGSKDAIAGEKKKICSFFTGKQSLFLYEDEPYFSFLSKGIAGKIIPYGQKSTKGFRGYKDLGLDGIAINWEGSRVRFPLWGIHNLHNALGALAVARELGLSNSDIIEGLSRVKPLFGRSQVYKGAYTVIMDCYNSNPDSVKEVLSFLHTLSWKGRKIVVLGSMLELGDEADAAHTLVVQKALSLSFDGIYLFGEEFKGVYKTLKEKELNAPLYWTDKFESLQKEVKDVVEEGDLILLKGSRGVALERLFPELQKTYITGV